VHGRFVLHGSEHELIVPSKLSLPEITDGSAKFHPSSIGASRIRAIFSSVNHSVEIELELKGALQNPTAL